MTDILFKLEIKQKISEDLNSTIDSDLCYEIV